jgi:hypothetical protein
MMIVLLRIIGKRFLAQFSTRPRQVKRMFQEMFLRDVIIDVVKMLVHKTGLDISVLINAG